MLHVGVEVWKTGARGGEGGGFLTRKAPTDIETIAVEADAVMRAPPRHEQTRVGWVDGLPPSALRVNLTRARPGAWGMT